MRQRTAIAAACLIMFGLAVSDMVMKRWVTAVNDIPATANDQHKDFTKILGKCVMVREKQLVSAFRGGKSLEQEMQTVLISEPENYLWFSGKDALGSPGTKGSTWYFLSRDSDWLRMNFKRSKSETDMVKARFVVTDTTLELFCPDPEGGGTIFRYVRDSEPDLIANAPAIEK